eukprot:Plantae.Rhodophyta-Palmaria_palmata.ctg17417.p1 GENE.Plantae.Rhodophyta-Palmaria_palmata.ctg17417~~Plantae.Rhodophyta-Palmaria_palmata.ctg17417.p1  ORF type:complete len:272 (-),score=28.33 Plantae.Rhodophyta-Palmaria_palmata.ctg17417:102-917(-)
MTSLLDPNASVRGVPNGIPAEAPTGFLLGDHAKNASDVLEAKYNPRGMPLELGPIGRRFEAYQNNGGTVVAVSGKDYTIVASDTRLGQGYSIPARYVSRIIKLTNKVVLASSGMQADIATLHKVLRVRLTQYVHTHGKEMSLEAVSQMLSNMLYYRRFQPYYTFNVLGGLDESGHGWSYGYDAIGSHEKVRAVCSGTGQSLLQPVLDNQVEFRQTSDDVSTQELELNPCVELIKDAFTSAGERDIYTGDTVEICKIDGTGVSVEKFQLKSD